MSQRVIESVVGARIRVSSKAFRSTVKVINPMGLHARPASLFVELANKYLCEVMVQKGNERIDGKSILSLLSLSAEAGTDLLIETRGDQAEEALAALVDLVQRGFNELTESSAG